jgi:hypothetical protein
MLLLSEHQMALQQRMTNNAYYAQAVERVQAMEEAASKRREEEVWSQMEQESMRERQRVLASAHAASTDNSTTNVMPISPIRPRLAGNADAKDDGGGGGDGDGETKDSKQSEEDRSTARAAESKEDGGSIESQDCCVCMSDKKSVVLLPCRHMCVCQACGLDDETLLDKCPMCRRVIEHRFRVFT